MNNNKTNKARAVIIAALDPEDPNTSKSNKL